ncbi:MAG TPA: sigma-70 family RNA polymerase sigma factor [Terracidiphilus sp.]|nr:sigma-70 family RNA polymerase sigma factor [Terracidiphilus sp.]
MNSQPSEQTGLLKPDAAPSGPSESVRLVRAIAEGSHDAEKTFAERYARPVLAMLVARLRNLDVASDLKQDVLIEALCALRRGQVKDPEKLNQFVIGIARNCLNNYFRASSRITPVELPEDLPDLSPPPDQRDLFDREDRALRAIRSLDRIDRSILQMTLVDGLKPGVIASELGLNPDVVRQRKVRATRRVVEFIHRESQKSATDHTYPGRVK